LHLRHSRRSNGKKNNGKIPEAQHPLKMRQDVAEWQQKTSFICGS
jgi:hypothetical protein